MIPGKKTGDAYGDLRQTAPRTPLKRGRDPAVSYPLKYPQNKKDPHEYHPYNAQIHNHDIQPDHDCMFGIFFQWAQLESGERPSIDCRIHMDGTYDSRKRDFPVDIKVSQD